MPRPATGAARRRPPAVAAYLRLGESGRDGLESLIASECRKYPQIKRFHDVNSQRKKAGWPDDAIMGPGGVIFRENKGDGGVASPEQIEVIALMRAHGLDADFWTADDWRSGRIAREIRRVAMSPRKRAST